MNAPPGNAEFQIIFDRIRAMYRVHENLGVVLHDEPHRYHLGTHDVRKNDGYRLWFGGVEIKKNYVSAHLMPVYVHPVLLEGLTPALRKRMQGKACFNFKNSDEVLLTELAGLVAQGAAVFRQSGALREDQAGNEKEKEDLLF